MAVNLQYDNAGTKVLADGVIAAFDETFSKTVGTEDASEISNNNESLAITNTAELLSIDSRPMPSGNDTLFLNMARLTKPQYTLQIFAQQMTGNNVQAYLRDSYLNTLQSLSLIDTNLVAFNVTADAASYNAERFTILFSSSQVLPVKFVSVNATQKGEDIKIEWKVSEETGIRKYEIEHSVDGLIFSKLSEVPVNNISGVKGYEWLDVNAVHGNNYYRIRALQQDGKFFLSKMVMAKSDAGSVGIRVVPNPVKDQQVNIQFRGMARGNYTLALFNSQGQQIISKTFAYTGGSSNQTVQFNKILAAGIYHLRIYSAGTDYEQKVFIE
jgi:hypothetical protein